MHILLTRPLEDSSEMILKFTTLGHKVSHLPLLKIEQVKFDVTDFSIFKAIIFTSANAIKFLGKNNLNKNIFLLGHKKNVFPFFYKAKATIITSLWEDPGAVMIESAFCNTPIISSDCKNGPSEFIMNNEAGYLFKSNDLKSLSTVIDDFINKPDVSTKQKIITAKKRCKKFTFFNHYKKLKSILNV